MLSLQASARRRVASLLLTRCLATAPSPPAAGPSASTAAEAVPAVASSSSSAKAPLLKEFQIYR